MDTEKPHNNRFKPEIGRGCAFCDCGSEVEAKPCDGCFKLHETAWLEEYPVNVPSDIVEVRFKNTRRSFYQNVNNLPLKRGDIVAVEASPGHDIGIVSLTGDLVARQMRRTGFNPYNGEFRKIYRKAKPYDIERWQEAIALEHETMIASRQIAADMGLNMKIGDVEYQGDGTEDRPEQPPGGPRFPHHDVGFDDRVAHDAGAGTDRQHARPGERRRRDRSGDHQRNHGDAALEQDRQPDAQADAEGRDRQEQDRRSREPEHRAEVASLPGGQHRDPRTARRCRLVGRQCRSPSVVAITEDARNRRERDGTDRSGGLLAEQHGPRHEWCRSPGSVPTGQWWAACDWVRRSLRRTPAASESMRRPLISPSTRSPSLKDAAMLIAASWQLRSWMRRCASSPVTISNLRCPGATASSTPSETRGPRLACSSSACLRLSSPSSPR